jgi:hypothetical protein
MFPWSGQILPIANWINWVPILVASGVVFLEEKVEGPLHKSQSLPHIKNSVSMPVYTHMGQ